MTVRRTATAALAVVVLATSLAGCADQTERYHKQQLSDLAVRSDTPDDEVLDQTLDVWRDLRDAAPGDIADEWSTLVFALEGLVDAFRRAGTTPSQYDPASPPKGVTKAEADLLHDAAAELVSRRVSQAGDAVEQHARDVCQVDLGLDRVAAPRAH